MEDGPDLAKDGIGRWRQADLRDRIKDRFEVVPCRMARRQVLLHKLNFSAFRCVRWQLKADLAAQETYKNLADLARAANSTGTRRWTD